jgi:two-component system, sensor histidine kinase YesM
MAISRRYFHFIKTVNFRLSLFTKINGLIVLLFIPIVIMYSFTNQITLNVLSQELQTSNAKKLSLLSSQIDARIDQMMDFATVFSRDPNVRKFNGLSIGPDDPYDRMQTRYAIQEKIFLISGVRNIWPVSYSVFSQNNKGVISNVSPPIVYDEAYLNKHVNGKWTYRQPETPNMPGAFYWYVSDSDDVLNKLGGSNLVVETSFSQQNIQTMLDKFKSGGNGDPFFYYPGNNPILNQNVDSALVNGLIQYFDGAPLQATEQRIVDLKHKKYLISAVKSSYLGWYLVDYVPLEQVLGPIKLSRNLFYLSMALLFVAGIAASIMLYKHVQRPIIKLIRGFQSVSRGIYSTRIYSNEQNEFAFLFKRFNEMSQQIQDLIENVLKEKLRVREATLKQLQAQINPHFLYNSLGFIINMTQMKEEEAVVSMAYNLSAYYRYTIRLEKPTATLNEEFKLLINYLDIQKLRNVRIHYHIDIPEEMLTLQIPRLMLQPIIENAVLHGIDRSYSSGEIRIQGEMKGQSCTIWIDDDGAGMTAEAINKLNRSLSEPLLEEMGFGLWNVNQRMVHEFGEDSYLRFSPSHLGGIRAAFFWKTAAKDESYRTTPTNKGA